MACAAETAPIAPQHTRAARSLACDRSGALGDHSTNNCVLAVSGSLIIV